MITNVSSLEVKLFMSPSAGCFVGDVALLTSSDGDFQLLLKVALGLVLQSLRPWFSEGSESSDVLKMQNW